MKKNTLLFSSLLLIITVIACTTTTLTQVWRDPSLMSQSVKKMMIIGIAKEPAKRMLFEDLFAQKLLAHGVSVIKSYKVISLEELNNKQGAIEKIRTLGVDAVLATRLIDKKTVETYYPPTYNYAPSGVYGSWGGYYGMGYSYMSSPGYTVSEQVAKLETNVYDAKSEKLAWTALSDTWIDRAAPDQLFSDFVNVVVDRMAKDGFIPSIPKK